MNTKKRLTNWDLLRALSMFLVVVVHIAPQLGSFRNINASAIASTAAIICDPIFFCLSGYFALKPLKKSYKEYLFAAGLYRCFCPSLSMLRFYTPTKRRLAHFRIPTTSDIPAALFKVAGGLSQHSFRAFW